MGIIRVEGDDKSNAEHLSPYLIYILVNRAEGEIMTKETQLAALYFRKNKLERNGKNSKGQGVLRKINRQIRKLKEQEPEYV